MQDTPKLSEIYKSRSSCPEMFSKQLFLEISKNSQENTCARVPFLIKLQSKACNFIKKEALAQVLSFEFCEICYNTFLHRTPLVAASVNMEIEIDKKNVYLKFKISRLIKNKKYSAKSFEKLNISILHIFLFLSAFSINKKRQIMTQNFQ